MNNKTTSKFLDRPFLSACVLLVAMFAFRVLFNVVMVLVFPESMNITLKENIMYWTITVIFLVLWLVYRGVRKSNAQSLGLKISLGKTILVCLPALYSLIILISKVADGGLTWDKESFFSSLALCVSAGIVEEIMCRDIPIGNAMRNINTRKQMLTLVFLTSVVFGSLHMYNILAESSVAGAIAQSIGAAGFGFIFASIYLRTGSIIPVMIVHIIHDFITGYAPLSSDLTVGQNAAAQAAVDQNKFTVIGVMLVSALVWALVGMFLLRKSKWEQIKKNFNIEG